MSKKSSPNNKKPKHKQEVSVFDTMSKKELIEFGAERLAELLWKTWLFKKSSNNKKLESDRDNLN